MYNSYLIIGSARSGLAAAKYLMALGKKVYLTDMNLSLLSQAMNSLPNLPVENFIFGKQPKISELGVEAVIISPGIPLSISPIIEAANLNITVLGEIELAFESTDAKIIGITGTNGKTTTTSLVGHLIQSHNYQSPVVGNIGIPMIEVAPQLSKNDVLVCELSSFQLATIINFRSHIALILNLTPDHLDRHHTLANYLEAKANILKNQRKEDKLILNQDDSLVFSLKNRAVGEVWTISQCSEVDRGIYLKDDLLILRDENDIVLLSKNDLQIKGKHNVENAMGAALVAYLYGVSIEKIIERMKTFQGVSHRMEFVATIDNITYINDSKGTNPDATIKALESYNKPIVLILGGKNKGSDFTDLIKLAKEKCRHVVVLGETRPLIVDALNKIGDIEYSECTNFEESVHIARQQAKNGDIVLLSPACASWDMFKSFEERGELFKKVVKEFE